MKEQHTLSWAVVGIGILLFVGGFMTIGGFDLPIVEQVSSADASVSTSTDDQLTTFAFVVLCLVSGIAALGSGIAFMFWAINRQQIWLKGQPDVPVPLLAEAADNSLHTVIFKKAKIMSKNLNPNYVSIGLFGFTLFVLLALPAFLNVGSNTDSDANGPSQSQVDDAPQGQIVNFTLITEMGGEPLMSFVGVGGEIDGVVNPTLTVNMGDTVQIKIINGNPALHDLKIDEFNVYSGELREDGQTKTVKFVANQPGNFDYYCSIPGHRMNGMEGLLRVIGTVTVGDQVALDESQVDGGYGSGHANHNQNQSGDVFTAAPAVENPADIIRDPKDLPAPLNNSGPPQHHVVEMTALEVDGQLADGTTYRYMTFDGKVPGPMLRMTVGDTMEVRLHNKMDSLLPHSIDLHAVTGPGGGAEFTQTLAGEISVFTFRALQPGLYVYHCATASIGHHISSGMYGLILVEPVGGLSLVDHEFYVMQGEIYTAQPFDTKGHLEFSHEKMLDESPEYYVFNGASGALTLDEYALRTQVGDSVRIYFGVGGPNAISSFHVIGEIFDRVYDEGSLTSEPLTNVQTTLVPPGGSTVVEFTMDVPGRYILVDHSLSRLERGLVGFLYAEGPEDNAIYRGSGLPEQSGH